MKETALRNWCLEYLHSQGVLAWKNNTGGMINKQGHLVKFGVAGAPDIMGILASQQGRILCIECKVGKNRLSQDQAKWLGNAYANGATCAVIYTVDDMIGFVADGFGNTYWSNKLFEHIKKARPDKPKKLGFKVSRRRKA